jgi:YfiH family protein
VSVRLITADALSSARGVVHGFTTREGGVSTGDLSTLNLARRAGERDEHLVANWAAAVDALSPGWGGERLAIVDQVHGARVIEAEPRGPLSPVGEADALITDQVGVVLAVRTADCVPLLMSAGRVVAAVHAGWQGTAAGVVHTALKALLDRAGVGPSDVVAAVGPSICGRCYEVGPEVVAGLLGAGADDFCVGHSPRGRPLVDVGAAVMSQLRTSGVTAVERVCACTLEREDLWSHRRHGAASGRQAALIALAEP